MPLVAATVITASLITVATATPITLGKQFANVVIKFSTDDFEPGVAARGYCQGKGYATSAGYKFGFVQTNGPYHPGGRAFYPSINCLVGFR
jgi:hypothetical protein